MSLAIAFLVDNVLLLNVILLNTTKASGSKISYLTVIFGVLQNKLELFLRACYWRELFLLENTQVCPSSCVPSLIQWNPVSTCTTTLALLNCCSIEGLKMTDKAFCLDKMFIPLHMQYRSEISEHKFVHAFCMCIDR